MHLVRCPNCDKAYEPGAQAHGSCPTCYEAFSAAGGMPQSQILLNTNTSAASQTAQARVAMFQRLSQQHPQG